jgi:hypothetical protein
MCGDRLTDNLDIILRKQLPDLRMCPDLILKPGETTNVEPPPFLGCNIDICWFFETVPTVFGRRAISIT